MQVEDRKGILADVSSKIADINTNITNVEATGADDDHGAASTWPSRSRT